MSALERRLPSQLSTPSMASELKRRWTCLRRMRLVAGQDASVWGREYTPEEICQDLWTAFLLILENDGQNWDQLVGWARLHQYLQGFVQWDLIPASHSDELPEATEERSLALWLLWFLSNMQNRKKSINRLPQLSRLVTPVAFSWYAYASTHRIPWYQFASRSSNISPLPSTDLDPSVPAPVPRPLTPRPIYSRCSSFTNYFNLPFRISVPLMSQAAMNLFFTQIDYSLPQQGSVTGLDALPKWDSSQFDSEWAVLTRVKEPARRRNLSAPLSPYTPGMLTGFYEGKFVLPDWDTHVKLQAGGPPLPLYRSANFFQHYQTWRIQEHYAVSSHLSHGNRSFPLNNSAVRANLQDMTSPPLQLGSSMRAYLPAGSRILPVKDGVAVWKPESGGERPQFFRTWREYDSSEIDLHEGLMPYDENDEFVSVIVTGETSPPILAPQLPTMMNPGSFAQGTIRRKDGLIVLRAIPIDQASGEWLYIGRVTGDGIWTGRWRAREQAPTSMVYEGIFQMRKLQPNQIPLQVR